MSFIALHPALLITPPKMNLRLWSRCQRSRWRPGPHSPAALDTVSCPSPPGKCQSWWGHLKQDHDKNIHPLHYMHSVAPEQIFTLNNSLLFAEGNEKRLAELTHVHQVFQEITARAVLMLNLQNFFFPINQSPLHVVEYFPSCVYNQHLQLCRANVICSLSSWWRFSSSGGNCFWEIVCAKLHCKSDKNVNIWPNNAKHLLDSSNPEVTVGGVIKAAAQRRDHDVCIHKVQLILV